MTGDIVTGLSAPFPPERIHWRVQGKPYARDGKHSAMALAYLDARDVMDRLDEVCGPEGWQSYIDETPKGRVICRLSIKIGDEWITKSDGAGDTEVEGEKGGISDALKRAAVSWGIGRYLYRIKSPWVACEVTDKGAWKRWTEDPWDRVRNPPSAPKAIAPPKPAPVTGDPVKEAADYLADATDLEDLQRRWSNTLRDLKLHPTVSGAKEVRKRQLSAPPVKETDQIPY